MNDAGPWARARDAGAPASESVEDHPTRPSPAAEAASSSGDPPSFSELETVGKYRDLVQIGQGAMGRVYRAYDPVLDRRVAIKTVLPGAAIFHETAMLRRFQREARIAAGLNHPNIVTVFDFGQEAGVFYLVMEYLEGHDLGELLRARKVRSLESKLEVMEQVCEGVGFAHQKGMVHRDLKPSNVHVSDGRAKILDFGLARWAEGPKTTLGVAGTPQYMSPEQVRGESVDARSDVFSLGAMFYEMLGDQRCFPAPTLHAILFQVLQRQPESLRVIKPELPLLADLVVSKALAKEPEHRFADGQELLESVRLLRQVVGGSLAEAEAVTALGMQAEADDAKGDAGRLPEVGPDAQTPLPDAGPDADTASVSLPHAPSVSGAEIPGTMSPSAPRSQRASVVFLHEDEGDKTLVANPNSAPTLLDLALDAGIPHFHECGGRGRCSTCRVRVEEGSGLLPPNQVEQRMISRLGWGPELRLACQAQVVGDIQVHRLIHDAEDFGLLRNESKRSAPRETTLAVLSVRVRNAKDILERSAPYDVVHLLNRFYYEVGEPILEAGGVISEYRDAGLIAYFGLEKGTARQKCLAAVRAGLRVFRRLDEVSRYLRQHFAFDPEFGVGLHFGRSIVGQLGHPSKQYVSALGDANFIAGWLAGLRPHGDPCILATEEVVNVVEEELDLGEVITDSDARGLDREAWEVRGLGKPDAVDLVQTSFDQVVPAKTDAARLFYELLFHIDPSVEPLFGGVDMSQQAEKLMDLLGTAVQSLGRFEQLKPLLRDLGKRHAGYGVELRHFDSVEQALLETMSQMLGKEFTLDVRQAWTQILGQISAEMIEAAGY